MTSETIHALDDDALDDDALVDDALVAAFEDCTLPPARLDHAAHVRLAWIYLQRQEPALALHRITSGLRRYVTALGQSAKYHETITWAFVILIAERLERTGRDQPWARFSASNPDLFSSGLLGTYYPQALLDSDLARRVFVLPGSPPRSSS